MGVRLRDNSLASSCNNRMTAGSPASDGRQRMVRRERQLGANGIAGANIAAGEHNAHDACLADELAMLVVRQHRSHQPGSVIVQLMTRVSQPRHLHDRRGADVKPRVSREPQQGDAVRQDVLPENARTNLEAPSRAILRE